MHGLAAVFMIIRTGCGVGSAYSRQVYVPAGDGGGSGHVGVPDGIPQILFIDATSDWKAVDTMYQ
jgi:hypothetical protein